MSNTYTVFEKNELFVIGRQPCTLQSIEEAQYGFTHKYGRDAEVIRYNHEVYYQLVKDLDRAYYDVRTIRGLKLELDAILPTGAWRVGVSKEVLTEVDL